MPHHDGQRPSLLGEGKPARQQLVEHDARRVDVGGGPEIGAAGLFRRHVGGGAKQLTGSGGQRVVIAEHPGDPEVGHLQHAVLAEEHIFGLHVTVQHPMLVCAAQTRARHHRDGAHGSLVKAPVDEPTPDGAARQPFHDQDAGVVVFNVVVHGDDMRMVD